MVVVRWLYAGQHLTMRRPKRMDEGASTEHGIDARRRSQRCVLIPKQVLIPAFQRKCPILLDSLHARRYGGRALCFDQRINVLSARIRYEPGERARSS